MVPIMIKPDLKWLRHLQDAFDNYNWKMIAHITMLVIIVYFLTSLVIQMACAGGPDL